MMPRRREWPSDFSDCAPITSPSKHARRAVPEVHNSSSDEEDTCSLVSYGPCGVLSQLSLNDFLTTVKTEIVGLYRQLTVTYW